MTEKIEQETFKPHVDSSFHATDEEGNRHELKLVELEVNEADPRLEQFSLIFHGPLDPVLPQMQYAIEHGEIGECSLFLVPIGQDAEKKVTLYQSVFSRFKEGG